MTSIGAILILALEGGEEIFKEMSESFGTFWKDYLVGVLVLMIVLAAGAFFALYFLRPFLEARGEFRKVWRALVEAHHLTRSDETALRELASRGRVANACEVFVRKSLFDREISVGRNARRLTELRAKLFS